MGITHILMSILVIDVGSSSVRTLLFDDNAQSIPQAEVRCTHSFTSSADGASTASPADLRRLVEACLDEILSHPQASEIEAVGMACFVGNVLALDKNGRPLTPLFTYADTRGKAQIKRFRQTIDSEASHQRTGCLLHTAYYPTRLAWCRENQLEIWAKVALWCDFATYCYQQWFGRPVPASYSVMSWSGLLNRANLTWDEEWLAHLKLSSDKLPELADFATIQHGLTETYDQRWPMLRDVPFYLAVGDGAAANIGSGAIDDDHIALTIGTTAAIRRISTEKLPPVPNGLWSYRVTAQYHLIGGATSEGGNIYQWAENTFKLSDSGAIENYLLTHSADTHGLTVLPLLAGERSPGFNPLASGALVGLNLATKPIHILQALVESVALRLALIAEQLDLAPNAKIMASGGVLARSEAWTQILANALNRPVQRLAHNEITARGVAILLLSHLHQQAWGDFPVEIRDIIEPEEDDVERLQEAGARQRALYAKLWGD